MQHVISYTEYTSISSHIGQKSRVLEQQYAKTLDKLTTFWLKPLGADKVALLSFIAARTLKYGKIAEKIPFPAFLEGTANDEGRTFCGLPFAERYIRRMIDDLTENNFIHKYFAEKAVGIKDQLYRYYEINFKKIQNLTYSTGELMGILRTPRVKKVEKNDGIQPRTRMSSRDRGVCLPKTDPNTYIQSTKVDNRIAKAIPLGDAARTDAPLNVFPSKRNLQSISKASTTTSTIAAAVNAAMNESRTKHAANVEAICPKDFAKIGTKALTKAAVQKIVTNAMRTYHSQYTNISVTNIAFGLFKKKVKALEMPDVEDFITWVIRRWDDITFAHLKAIRRRAATGDYQSNTSEMPRSPDFTTLAYRFGYFQKAYSNHLVSTERFGTKEDNDAKEIARLKLAVANSKKENAGLRDIARKAIQRRKECDLVRAEGCISVKGETPRAMTRTRRTPPSARAVPLVTGEDLDLGSDDYIPTWEELVARDKK